MEPFIYQDSFKKSALFFFVIGSIGSLLNFSIGSFWEEISYMIINYSLMVLLCFLLNQLTPSNTPFKLTSLKYAVEFIMSFFWALIIVDILFNKQIYFSIQQGISIYLVTYMVFEMLLKVNPLMFENYFKEYNLKSDSRRTQYPPKQGQYGPLLE